MLNFSANLSTLFTEVPFLERFSRARSAGFQHVEFQFPYQYPVDLIQHEINAHGLNVVLFNLPPGDWNNRERGIAILPDRRQEFYESVDEALRYATALGCPRLHCMAGIMPEGMKDDDAWQTYRENLQYAAAKLSVYGITLLIEPINPFDMPGYFLSDLHKAFQTLDDLKLPNLKIQFDFYHIQRIQGELITSFAKYKEHVGHVQIADNPGRHQPGSGEIHYSRIFAYLDQTGYPGYIGLEYNPEGATEDSLSWINSYIQGTDRILKQDWEV